MNLNDPYFSQSVDRIKKICCVFRREPGCHFKYACSNEFNSWWKLWYFRFEIFINPRSSPINKFNLNAVFAIFPPADNRWKPARFWLRSTLQSVESSNRRGFWKRDSFFFSGESHVRRNWARSAKLFTADFTWISISWWSIRLIRLWWDKSYRCLRNT